MPVLTSLESESPCYHQVWIVGHRSSLVIYHRGRRCAVRVHCLPMHHKEGCFRLAITRCPPSSDSGLVQPRHSWFRVARRRTSSGESVNLPCSRSCSRAVQRLTADAILYLQSIFQISKISHRGGPVSLRITARPFTTERLKCGNTHVSVQNRRLPVRLAARTCNHD